MFVALSLSACVSLSLSAHPFPGFPDTPVLEGFLLHVALPLLDGGSHLRPLLVHLRPAGLQGNDSAQLVQRQVSIFYVL